MRQTWDLGRGTWDNNTLLTEKKLSSLPLLVRSRTGYQNLCRLVTLMKIARAETCKAGGVCGSSPDELAEYAEGLVCLTGGHDGPLAKALDTQRHRNTEEAQRRAGVVS